MPMCRPGYDCFAVEQYSVCLPFGSRARGGGHWRGVYNAATARGLASRMRSVLHHVGRAVDADCDLAAAGSEARTPTERTRAAAPRKPCVRASALAPMMTTAALATTASIPTARAACRPPRARAGAQPERADDGALHGGHQLEDCWRPRATRAGCPRWTAPPAATRRRRCRVRRDHPGDRVLPRVSGRRRLPRGIARAGAGPSRPIVRRLAGHAGRRRRHDRRRLQLRADPRGAR